MIMCWCPRNKFFKEKSIGFQKGILQYFGQLVDCQPIRLHPQKLEIFDYETKQYCGVIDRNDLLPRNTPFFTDAIGMRLAACINEPSNIKDESILQVEQEIKEKAAIIKERIARRRQIEQAQEKERKYRKKQEQKELNNGVPTANGSVEEWKKKMGLAMNK